MRYTNRLLLPLLLLSRRYSGLPGISDWVHQLYPNYAPAKTPVFNYCFTCYVSSAAFGILLTLIVQSCFSIFWRKTCENAAHFVHLGRRRTSCLPRLGVRTGTEVGGGRNRSLWVQTGRRQRNLNSWGCHGYERLSCVCNTLPAPAVSIRRYYLSRHSPFSCTVKLMDGRLHLRKYATIDVNNQVHLCFGARRSHLAG